MLHKLTQVKSFLVSNNVWWPAASGKDKESNWLLAPEGDYNVTLRLYTPDRSILSGDGDYQLFKKWIIKNSVKRKKWRIND